MRRYGLYDVTRGLTTALAAGLAGLLLWTATLVGQQTTVRFWESMGIVASTGCNTVFGSTYPFNPYLVPWTNSLFENGPTVALGIRARWDAAGHPERRPSSRAWFDARRSRVRSKIAKASRSAVRLCSRCERLRTICRCSPT